ncbi:MAG: nitrate reductase subunit beta [Chloroflexota bacterium]
MDVRAQIAAVFHLDKCIGCHTCSISCKNIWTDRRGTDYMWWNNVETKPGTGYPTLYEDQNKYRGGWELIDGKLHLRATGKVRGMTNIFHQPYLPTVDDYYEPWTYRYQDLFDAPAGDDQPTARPISQITGQYIDIKAGPNWDDDLGGSPIYAANDPNLVGLSDVERQELFELRGLALFYLPRICNHCLNPGCVAACPSGALYKRGEDGIVLVNQEVCRGWRYCVSGCPYKKVYYNWETGKSEKCIFCYPRQETGYAPACFHTCVGRIRYLGPIFYDAEGIVPAASVPDLDLVEAHRSIILNPSRPDVIAGARANGISDQWIAAAQASPTYKLIKQWRLALPLHAEFRTMPMVWYVPPLLPLMGTVTEHGYRLDSDELYAGIAERRVPMRYMANLLGAGNETQVMYAIAKQVAIRFYKRSQTVGDVPPARATSFLTQADCSPEEADEIYRLVSLPTFGQRHLVPPFQREMPISDLTDPQAQRGAEGLGFRQPPRREF